MKIGNSYMWFSVKHDKDGSIPFVVADNCLTIPKNLRIDLFCIQGNNYESPIFALTLCDKVELHLELLPRKTLFVKMLINYNASIIGGKIHIVGEEPSQDIVLEWGH